MQTVLKSIEAISETAGKVAKYLVIALVILMSYEVILRYAFNSPTAWNYETVTMIGGITLALGFSYAHKHAAHVRLDVIYSRLSRRTQYIIDIIGGIVCALPWVVLLVFTSGQEAWNSIITKEISTMTSWYPPMAPFRVALMLSLGIFAIQSLAQLIRDILGLIGERKHD